MYKLHNNIDGELTSIVKDLLGRRLSIPINEDNRHYQEYLEWLAEGNTPQPAD